MTDVAGQGMPQWPGTLTHRPDGVSTCPACNWAGIATRVKGRRSDVCPGCGDPDETVHDRKAVKVARNAPCPCGSGAKFKKCCGR